MFMEEERQEGRETKRGGGRGGRREGGRVRERIYIKSKSITYRHYVRTLQDNVK